jgi:hypothetical protein
MSDPWSDYFAMPELNFSRLKSFAISPLQYRHDIDHPRTDKPHFRRGSLMHAIVLEPETVAERFACYRDGKRDKRTKAYQEFLAAHEGKSILSESEWESAAGAAAAVLADPIAGPYLSGGVAEQTIMWTEPTTGRRCKARIDLSGAHLVDLKSTAYIEPRRFGQQAARLSYHAQLAWYLDGLLASGHDMDPTPILIVVQSEQPHDVVTYRLPDHVVHAGRDLYRGWLQQLQRCEESGVWPGVAGGEALNLHLPEWVYGDDDPLELTMGGQAITGGF